MTYIVIDAPGHHGTYVTVYSRHNTLDAAIRAARHHVGLIVSDDGGYTHWSWRTEAERRVANADDRAEKESEEYMARKYGRGSAQYDAAMSHPRKQRA